jgi:hypothetical protein
MTHVCPFEIGCVGIPPQEHVRSRESLRKLERPHGVWNVARASTTYAPEASAGVTAAMQLPAVSQFETQLATRARSASPALWAPFILVGEPQ